MHPRPSVVVIMAVYIIATAVLLLIFLNKQVPKSLISNSNTTNFRSNEPLPSHSNIQPSLTLTNGYHMELMIRMTAKPELVNFFYCTLFRSAALFWSPKLGNVTLILDEESKADHKFAAQIQQQQQPLGFAIKIKYEPLPEDATFLKSKRLGFGYNRQLWSSFFMDFYTDAEIIAWIDTDDMFSTPVTPENIFEGNKLRVTGIDLPFKLLRGWKISTRAALGKELVSLFGFFPTYIWRDTFTNCRNFILKYHNVSRFQDTFKVIHRPDAFQVVNPVTVVLTYAYYFEHDRYDWHFDANNMTLFNRKRTDRDILVPLADTSPDVLVVVHDKYYKPQNRQNPLKQGYCVAKRIVDILPVGCEKYKETINFQLFENAINGKWQVHYLDSWCKGEEGKKKCTVLIEKHYQNVKKYYKKGLYDLDLNRVLNVEKAAATVNITCPKIFDFP